MRKLITTTALMLGLLTGTANASVVGFNLIIGGNDANVPVFSLSNTSTAPAALTAFSFTIGDTSRHFDFVQTIADTTGGTSVLLSPDGVNNGVRSDIISLAFSGDPFTEGEAYVFKTDIDADPAQNVIQNYKTVFGNNDAPDNAIATVTFLLGGQVIELTDVFDDVIASSYTLSAQQSVSAVPLPAALPMLMTGLAGIGFMARRKKNAA